MLQEFYEKHRPNGLIGGTDLTGMRRSNLTALLEHRHEPPGWLENTKNLSSHQLNGPKGTWAKSAPGNGSVYWEELTKSQSRGVTETTW